MKKWIVKILLIQTVLFASCFGRHKQRLVILFDNVDKLAVGSEVKMRGVTIGEVSKLTLGDNRVWVTARIKKEIKIPAGSIFVIYSSLAQTTVNIEPSNEQAFFNFKDTANGKYLEKGLLDELISDSVTKEKVNSALDTIRLNMRDVMKKIRDSLDKE